ncbi:hypothetical protein PINS_up007677 [Pythium insidiosum]|nr:hypothetical protein PINS_up007677 [Pythium insidiosum]
MSAGAVNSESSASPPSAAAVFPKRSAALVSTDGDSDSSGEASARAKKARKPTYAARKEEIASLLEEHRVLQARLELLKQNVGIPTSLDHDTLEAAQRHQRAMEEALRAQQLALGNTQSLLSVHMNALEPNPLKKFIHLSADAMERRHTLLSLRREKLDRCYRFVQERLHHIPMTSSYHVEERYVTANGNRMISRFERLLFPGVQGVKQVHDALLFYLTNMEISISETLGHVTLRDDIDAVETRVSNHRVVSTTSQGLTLELNAVHCYEYYESFEELGGQEFSIVCADSVDVDDLHPYTPSERIRKDVSAVVTLTSFRRRRSDGKPVEDSADNDDETEVVVVMSRCAYLTLFTPAFPVPEWLMEEMHADASNWGDVMLKSIRDTLYGVKNF